MTDKTKEFLQKLKDSGNWNNRNDRNDRNDGYDYSNVVHVNTKTKDNKF